jgi:hypothetical protein
MVYMTEFSAGSEHSVKYIIEATFNIIPTPLEMIDLRHTGTSLNLSKDTFQSAELRSDRQISDFRHGNKRAQGDLDIELSFAEYDPFIASALCGTWQGNYVAAGNDIKSAKTGNYIYSSTTTFSSLVIGDVIYASGFTSNDNIYVISAVAATKLTLSIVPNAITATESGIKDVSIIRMPSVRASTDRYTFTVEREFGDIDRWARFTGCVVGQMNLSLKPNAIVTGKLSIVGKAAAYAATALDAATTVSQDNSPLDAFSGSLYEGGVAVALITGIDLNISNNANPNFVVGSPFASNITLGRSDVTGDITAYFQDMEMLNKFINETESSLEVYLGTGTSGYNSYRIYLPRIKYGSGDNTVSGEGPIEMKISFQALLDSNLGTNIIFTSIPLGNDEMGELLLEL